MFRLKIPPPAKHNLLYELNEVAALEGNNMSFETSAGYKQSKQIWVGYDEVGEDAHRWSTA